MTLIVGQGGDLSDFPDQSALGYYTLQATPWASLLAVACVILAAAYVGSVLPARIEESSAYAGSGIRRSIAVIGLVVGSIVGWVVLPLSLDAVLAVGYTLAPVVFAIAALRAPARPAFRPSRRAFIVLTAAWGIGVAALLVALVNAPIRTLTMDLSAASTLPESVGLEPDDVEVDHWPIDAGSLDTSIERLTTIDIPDPGRTIAADLSSVQVEVWPAIVQDGVLRLGAEPLIVEPAQEPDPQSIDLEWSMPQPRTQQLVATLVIGITPDGRRVILGEPAVGPTPPWQGTVAAWWLGD
ncbi:MAG: hypothetical protein A2V85_17430 [Chloroflexi bacterium RBG_16_72_14]|nr:MAG: hypothetical protein A2V85_17430 [Chloroflexi bacterium RBG_16_72_14]